MALVEIDQSLRFVLDVDDPSDIEGIKVTAKMFEFIIFDKNHPYKTEVLPFNPAAWDFNESPVNSDRTIGELYEEQKIESLK